MTSLAFYAWQRLTTVIIIIIIITRRRRRRRRTGKLATTPVANRLRQLKEVLRCTQDLFHCFFSIYLRVTVMLEALTRVVRLVTNRLTMVICCRLPSSVRPVVVLLHVKTWMPIERTLETPRVAWLGLACDRSPFSTLSRSGGPP